MALPRNDLRRDRISSARSVQVTTADRAAQLGMDAEEYEWAHAVWRSYCQTSGVASNYRMCRAARKRAEGGDEGERNSA